MNALKRLNDALPSLVVTIIVYGLLVELIGVWFVKDKIRYSSGLAIGIACAIFLAVHLAIVIRDAVEAADGNTKVLSAKSVFRYLVVCIIFIAMMYFKLGSLIPAFIGVLGIKVCAYVQPFIHKRILRDHMFDPAEALDQDNSDQSQEYEPQVDSERGVRP